MLRPTVTTALAAGSRVSSAEAEAVDREEAALRERARALENDMARLREKKIHLQVRTGERGNGAGATYPVCTCLPSLWCTVSSCCSVALCLLCWQMEHLHAYPSFSTKLTQYETELQGAASAKLERMTAQIDTDYGAEHARLVAAKVDRVTSMDKFERDVQVGRRGG